MGDTLRVILSSVGLLVVLVLVVVVVWAVRKSNRRREAALRYRARVQNEERESMLLEKYGDPEVAGRIINGYVWVGATAEQLTDSLGAPADVDRRVLRSKLKEVWKYGHRGGRRYALRITVENGVVIGWDEKR